MVSHTFQWAYVLYRGSSLPRRDCTGHVLIVIHSTMHTFQYLFALQLWTGRLPLREAMLWAAELHHGTAGCLLTPIYVHFCGPHTYTFVRNLLFA